MYCPKCFNNSLTLHQRGVVDIVINGKHMDSGRFYFKLDQDHQEITKRDFRQKIEEFFKWYSRFENIDPIQVVRLVTANMRCEKGCVFDPNTKFSVVDELIPAQEVQGALVELGEKYSMKIQLENI